MTTGARGRRIVPDMISARRVLLWSAVSALALAVVVRIVAAQSGGVLLDRLAPAIAGGPWINSEPLAPAALRGRVVFVEFWTYG